MTATAARSSAVATVLVRRHRPPTRPLAEPPRSFTFFPEQYFISKKLRGVEIIFRAIQPDDEPLMIEFHNTVSDQSVHFRYFAAVSLRERTLHERLRRHCAIDHTREFALVADWKNAKDMHQILGVARLFKEPGRGEAEFAILISDSWQGKGLGTFMLKLLVQVGRESHLCGIIGRILPDNLPMTHVSRKAGFSLQFNSSAHEWLADLRL